MSTYEISKSSLLSLKAEILRKQQEVTKVKVKNEAKKNTLKKQPLDIKNKGSIESREDNIENEVDEDLLKKSRSVLEYKTKLYEELSKGKQSKQDHQRNEQYLVRFDKKLSSDLPPSDSEPESEDNCYQSDDNCYQSDGEGDPLEKWVEYVDCLGRTRKCMQKDLEYLKSKDKELNKIVDERKTSECETEKVEIRNDFTPVDDGNKLDESSHSPESSELLSSDMRREMLRQQWEKEEEVLLNKKNIHYQDILFGEARTHGVGYYSFSKDEEERAKQQDALRKLREETKKEQKTANELRNSREKMLAARLKAARNRKRARMGLPPEEDEPLPEKVEEEVTIQEEQQKETDAKEILLEQARKNHIRPWDIGKEGVKEHHVMSQEEWVEKKREERPTEFAPPTKYRKHFRAEIKDDAQEIEDDKSLKFSTKKYSKQRKLNLGKKRNEIEEIQQSPLIQPTPIQDLEDGADIHDTLLEHYREVSQHLTDDSFVNRNVGAEIAPPPTYEYYGPGGSGNRKTTTKQGNIEQSIEEGLKFLRKQVEQKERSTKHEEDMFLF